MIKRMTQTWKNNIFRNGPAQVPFKVPEDMKPYNIVLDDEDDSAEVNMYGEVVSNPPTDWWTGERVEGLYIILSDFLNDMESLKNKKNVTFHINSPGGEVFAGVAIYNRMKEFKGTVSTVVDGLAASAASIIAQGASQGNRKVCNGSLTMIHGASSFMFGYYNANDMKDSIKKIEAIDKSIAEIYAKMTGLEQDKIKNMMSKTSWMSAQDAIDNGFADEIVDTGEKVTMSLNESRNMLTVNGVPMSVKGFANLPDYIPIRQQKKITTGPEPDVINTKSTGGNTKMTYEELMKTDPELVNQIRTEAINSVQGERNQQEIDKAVAQEVERMKSIDEIANKIADKTLVEKAKYGETKMSAAELALEALKAQEDAGAKFLNSVKNDADSSGVNNVTPQPNGNLPQVEEDKNDIAAGAALIAGVVKE